jgi:peptidoglycan hydrolase-like protein with peptidoglycan-binding domain
MQRTCFVPGARAGAAGLLAALILLCLPGATALAGTAAQGAEAPTAGTHLLTTGTGYAQPRGSAPVRELQTRLRALGLRPGAVDGLFGPQTRAAVHAFQRAAGLETDGIVGPHTRRALRKAAAPLLGHGTGYGEPGGSAEVRDLQLRLRRLGLRPGPVDGLYGPRTAAAVSRFQRGQDLATDGVAWPRTRRAIARNLEAERSPRTARAQSPDRPAEPNRARRLPVAQPPADVPATATQEGDTPELPWLLLSGLLAFALVAASVPLVEKLAVSARAAMPGLTTIPADDPAPPRSTFRAEPVATRLPSSAQPGGGNANDAIGYVSVTEPEGLAEPDLREQIASMDALCERRGWRLVEVARDVGPDRPGLTYALERLAAGEAGCLVVAELRRLGDSAAELAHILRWLREHEVRLVAADVALDTEAPDGRISADALISVGEREGTTTFGRPAVRDVPALKEHIVAMRSAGMTLQAIADRLNDEGVPTLRGGQKWRPSSIQAAAGYRRPQGTRSR